MRIFNFGMGIGMPLTWAHAIFTHNAILDCTIFFQMDTLFDVGRGMDVVPN